MDIVVEIFRGFIDDKEGRVAIGARNALVYGGDHESEHVAAEQGRGIGFQERLAGIDENDLAALHRVEHIEAIAARGEHAVEGRNRKDAVETASDLLL